MSDELTCGSCRFWAALPEHGPDAGQCRKRLHTQVVMRPVLRESRVAVAGNGAGPQAVAEPEPISYYPPAPRDMPACGEHQERKR